MAIRGFRKAYGLKFADQPREMDLSLTYIALASNKVDLIAGNSTEGRIAALDFGATRRRSPLLSALRSGLSCSERFVDRVAGLGEVLAKLANSIIDRRDATA